jgi:hypothetical protein
MPEVDRGIGKGLECVVQLTETSKAQQQAPELVFPSKHPLDPLKSFLKYRRIEQRLAASFRLLSITHIRVDIGNHAAIENGLAVGPAVVDAIQADNTGLKINSDHVGDADHFGQGLAQQRRFIAVARRRHERRDHVAIAVAEGHDLVAAFLGARRRAVAVDDRDIKKRVLMKLHHRAGKDRVLAAIGFPPPPSAIDAGIVDLGTTFAILVDRQFLPLATQIAAQLWRSTCGVTRLCESTGRSRAAPAAVYLQDVSDAVGGQRLTVSVYEDVLLVAARRHAAQSVQRVGRLAPKGQQPLLSAFAVQAHLSGRRQLEVVPAQACRLAHPGAAVVEKEQQSVVLPTVGSASVGLGDNRTHIVASR